MPIALITTNIRVAISEQNVYDHSVENYGAAYASGIPERELLRANGEIRDYLTAGDAGPLAITVRNDRGDEESLFSAKETAHMADVRALVQTLFTVQLLSVATVFTLAVVMLVLWPPRALAMAALCAALLTGGILGMSGIVAASGFDSAWSEFHVFAFSNDLWRLDPQTDHLIQMFPEAFWQDIATLIVISTLLEAALTVAVSGAYLALSRPHEEVRLMLPSAAVAGPAGHDRPKMTSPTPRQLFR